MRVRRANKRSFSVKLLMRSHLNPSLKTTTIYQVARMFLPMGSLVTSPKSPFLCIAKTACLAQILHSKCISFFFYYTLSSHNILQNWLLWVLELIKATIHTQTGCHICNMCVHLSVIIMLGAGFLHMHLVDILRIRSWEGHRKAFSTCSSHLCVVGPFFGKAAVMYMIQESQHLKI